MINYFRILGIRGNREITKNIARVRNWPDITISYSLFGLLVFLSFCFLFGFYCLFVFLSSCPFVQKSKVAAVPEGYKRFLRVINWFLEVINIQGHL